MKTRGRRERRRRSGEREAAKKERKKEGRLRRAAAEGTGTAGTPGTPKVAAATRGGSNRRARGERAARKKGSEGGLQNT